MLAKINLLHFSFTQLEPPSTRNVAGGAELSAWVRITDLDWVQAVFCGLIFCKNKILI
jgi:hypothetical protein